ncbi:MAG TPA: hotdog domain-containing protein [Hydrogenophaga sp.]|uniref:acyl-CoA thioesterase n=1 Tax=Hydrogenophaga sp. TaxID=1904254 RepID=UPI002CCBDA7D|nr:hotdog domain-containing protein [Hydrogenophaga sp.]HMN93266.1 hotdog domain-containing protein [Hydrogenophaga sp.]HMP10829.1 hotdog domain-containing protein [Hydrogenophaga sp.]
MSSITLRFLVEPSHIGAGGHVHAGTVMKWLDDAGLACATTWARGPCRTVYTSSIRFQRAVRVGDLVEVRARLAFTGETHMNITVELVSGDLRTGHMEKTAEALVVLVAIDQDGRPVQVDTWTPETPGEMALASSARAQFDSTRPAPL